MKPAASDSYPPTRSLFFTGFFKIGLSQSLFTLLNVHTQVFGNKMKTGQEAKIQSINGRTTKHPTRAIAVEITVVQTCKCRDKLKTLKIKQMEVAQNSVLLHLDSLTTRNQMPSWAR